MKITIINKVKIIKAHVPEKVKIYIENKLSKEIEYFEKKYSFQINFIADSKLIIPEYKIELLNKSKKIIDTVKHVNSSIEIEENKKIKKTKPNDKRDLKKSKKNKIIKKKIKKPRILWIRRKKKSLN